MYDQLKLELRYKWPVHRAHLRMLKLSPFLIMKSDWHAGLNRSIDLEFSKLFPEVTTKDQKFPTFTRNYRKLPKIPGKCWKQQKHLLLFINIVFYVKKYFRQLLITSIRKNWPAINQISPKMTINLTFFLLQ